MAKRKSRGKGKGSSFERRICKMLGLWWSEGKRDDIFWRTSNSGGRATVRKKKAQDTFGQEGDVQATDPIGQPLIDLCTIEVKCGYGRSSIIDIVDRPMSSAVQIWERWLEQASRESRDTGRWMLITKADRREVMIFLSLRLYNLLNQTGVQLRRARPYFTITPLTKNRKLRRRIIGTTLEEFMRLVHRDNIIEANKA